MEKVYFKHFSISKNDFEKLSVLPIEKSAFRQKFDDDNKTMKNRPFIS